jgi:DNA-binding transcriptional MerR regulator
MSGLSKYSIRDLEQISGIKAHTLRIWEKRYGLLRPHRTDTNIRFYSNEELKHLLNVSLLNRNGIKVSKIAGMSQVQIREQVAALSLIRTNDEDLVEGFIAALLDLDEIRFLKTFASALLRLGFEQTILQVVFPFFRRIGIMWQTGTINPAQEHFVSNIIRQKLYVAIDGLRVTPPADAPKALLFLPEQELHELSLLFYHYALRSRGVNTVYLGQAVPTESLPRIIASTQPDFLVTVATNELSAHDFKSFIRQIAQFSGHASLLLSGNLALQQSKSLPENVYLFKDLETLLALMSL